MMCACVRESVKAWDIGMTCEHSCINAYVVLNVFVMIDEKEKRID